MRLGPNARARRAGAALALLASLGALLLAPAGAPARALRAGLQAQGASWWQPPAHLTWYWQLQGTVLNTHPVAAYDIDGFENDAAEVTALHARGIHVICYIDVGTAERFRPDYHLFPAAVLGRSNGWPGERWLDIRNLSVIEPIMAARFRMCAEKGFDAIEPDNIEAFSNRSGFPITGARQLTFNEWVAQEAHALGMAVLQKNDPEQSAALAPWFDGALSEQCNQYRECASFAPYLAAAKPVLNAEYRLPTSRFCAADIAAGIVGARFNLALNGKLFTPCG
jgi:hypothetical protein